MGEWFIDLDALFVHNALEHDASFVSSDLFFGAANSRSPDPDLIKNFLSLEGGESLFTGDALTGSLSRAEIMEYQTSRVVNSRQTNPLHDFGKINAENGVFGRLGSMAGQATLMLVFNVDDPHYQTVGRNTLLSFLGAEQFPDGYSYDPKSYPEGDKLDFNDADAAATQARDEFRANLVTQATKSLSEGACASEGICQGE
jgi:hypothetical protein